MGVAWLCTCCSMQNTCRLHASMCVFSPVIRWPAPLQKLKPTLLRTPTGATKVQQLQLARQAYADRELSLAQLDDVVFMARSLEMQMVSEGDLNM